MSKIYNNSLWYFLQGNNGNILALIDMFTWMMANCKIANISKCNEKTMKIIETEGWLSRRYNQSQCLMSAQTRHYYYYYKSHSASTQTFIVTKLINRGVCLLFLFVARNDIDTYRYIIILGAQCSNSIISKTTVSR